MRFYRNRIVPLYLSINNKGVTSMAAIIVHGFPGSTYVQIVRLVLAHKAVEFQFRDLETEMNTPEHRELHPFEYVPILQHGSFTLYETSAIVGYIDETFPDPRLTPESSQKRAKMNQWISAVNAYYYPQIVYHLSHERSVFPALGIKSDERVVQAALPKIERALDVMERELNTGQPFLIGGTVTLADLFMVPCLTSLARTDEGRGILERHPLVSGWRERMEQLDSVKRFRAAQPPRKPIEHARRWVTTHRPGVLA
jgi:glutathione S-transferase